MRIATLNVQNMRLRGTHLDGARDSDMRADTGAAAAALDQADRRLTAALIRDSRADILVLQEVFDQATLEHFHRQFLQPLGAVYPFRICRPGNDGRGLDLAVLSSVPIDAFTSHAGLTAREAGIDPGLGLAPDRPVFRRDCLEIDIRGLTLFACHFKAPWPDPEAAWAIRRAEACAVRYLIARRFDVPAAARWLILGDLNDPRDAPKGRRRAIAPLLPPFSVNLADRLPAAARWTWYHPAGKVRAAPDKMLASPALAAANPDARPNIMREGLGHESGGDAGPRLPGAGSHRPHASDHALMWIDLPVGT